MIAAVGRRASNSLAAVPRAATRWTRRVDRGADRALERAHPPLRRARRRSARLGRGILAWLGLRLRPFGAFFFSALALAESRLRRAGAGLARLASAASEVVTPRRALGAAIVAAGACLIAAQFIDYRGVEIGQPGYAGLPGVATPPMEGVRTAGQAHGYLLAPLGLLAAVLGVLCARRDRGRLGLGVILLGLVSIAVILLVDLPRGLDAGVEQARFAGASAVLSDGFYAELAAAAGLIVAGLLYYARPCRIRTNSSGRAASARRRRPRRRASSRVRVARRA
jgi:hypothetical protein